MSGSLAKFAMLAALAVSASGCLPTGAGAPTTRDVSPPTANNAPPVEAPQDAKHTTQQVFKLQIFQLTVPLGAISRNADFWKPFDEQFLGIWQHDVLFKNGIRVGRALPNEFRDVENQLRDAERTNNLLIGTQAKDFEMELKRGIDRETVFAFDAQGRPEGRDFERADNLFMIGFNQVPRQPDHVRLTIAPAVREEGLKLEMREGGGIDWIKPTTLYNVGIDCELGRDECLVIAPSEKALEVNVSVGRTFMMEERPSARVEKVLVIIPTLSGTLQEVMPKK